MHVHVETTVDIAVPRTAVADFAVNPDNATIWYENIKSVEWETTPPVAVGSRFAFVARFLGKRLAYTYEVREFEPGELLVMSTSQGPFPMKTIYRWVDTPTGGTRMTLVNEGEPHGFTGIAGPLMSKAMRRANNKDLQRLKQILEARG